MNIRIATLGIVIAAATGCAGNISESRHGIAAGQWNVRMPTAESPVASLAFGKGGKSQRAAKLESDPQPHLAAASVQKHAQPVAKRPRPVVQTAVGESVPSRVEERLAPAPVSAREPVVLAQADADQRYAARQANSRQLENYKGGDAIVITTGAVLVIALIVILILLLT